MAVIFILTAFLSTGFCLDFPSDVIHDAVDIFHSLPLKLQICDTAYITNITFILYNKEHQQNGSIVTEANLNATNPTQPYIVIIHGWIQSSKLPWIGAMKDKYLNQGPANIIVVNWARYASINYAAAACAVPKVGILVGNFIYDLRVKFGGIRVDIIGFSLGAHVAGCAGQQVYNRSGSKVDKIVGLDAAGPLFKDRSTNERLDKDDALFVQGIHTNDYQFGNEFPYGTVDFFVNCAFNSICGALQPCCPFNPGVPTTSGIGHILPMLFCSHIRAVTYYLASMDSTDFLGVPCTCQNFARGLCSHNPTTVMGEHCPADANGTLFLNTNGMSPYPKGSAGTTGEEPFEALECFLWTFSQFLSLNFD